MLRFPFSIASIAVFAVLCLANLDVVHADPNVEASKDDALAIDIDGDNQADSDDTILYTVVITNTGNMDATGVSYSDTIDNNTTFVAGSLKTTPIARGDSFNVVGNVQIAVPAPGVLVNDSDPDGGSVMAVVIVGGSSINGGDVALAADGSFTYDPPPGFEGNDTFTYTTQDMDANTATATVTLTVSDMIWFVDAAAASGGDGRLTNPFDDLAVTTDSFDVNAADAAGDNIFVADGSYSGGLTLLNNQRLIGDGSSGDLATLTGISLPTNSVALPIFSGIDPVVTSSGDTVNVGQNNMVRGLTLGTSVGTAIRGTSVGTLTVAETSLSGGGAIDINTGTLAVSLDALSASSSTDEGIQLASVTGTFSVADPTGTIGINNLAAVDITGTGGGLLVSATFASVSSTSSATRGLRLANLTAGSSFNGGAATITSSTVDGVVLSNNAGSTFTFADLDIDNFSTNQRGLFASTSGTLNISDGDIDAGSGRGVDIDGTNLNVTLASVTSIGGTTAGIDLDTTTGTFEVTGDGVDASVGGNASGGTISLKTGSDGTNNGIGVLLNSATSVTLRRMQLNDFDNFAIRGSSVTGFALNNSTVSGANGSSAAADEGSILFENLLGSANILYSAIGGGLEDNVRIENSSGTLDRLTVDNTTINANHATLGNDGISVIANSSATLNVTVTNSTFTAAGGDQFESAANGSASMDVVFTDNTLSNNHANILSGGGGTNFSGGDNTTVTYDISRNTMRDALGHALNVFMGTGGTANWSGTIDDNDIGDATVSGSGSVQAHGINVEAQGAGTHTTEITNNTIVEFGDRGIALFAVDGSSTLSATVTDNTIAQPFGSFPQEAIYGQGGAASSDTNVICATILDNAFVGASGAFDDDFRLRQRKMSTFRLPGYAGTPGDTAAVVAFVQGNNTGMPSGSASVDWPGSGGGFTGGAACALPLLATGGEGPGGAGVKALTQAELTRVVAEAIDLWSATGLSRDDSAQLHNTMLDIADLPDGQLGRSFGTQVTIDHNGAGYGWSAQPCSTTPTSARMDLLSVVLHELGHVLGKDHADQPDLMADRMPTGVRRLPAGAQAVPEVEAAAAPCAMATPSRDERAASSRSVATTTGLSRRLVHRLAAIDMATLGARAGDLIAGLADLLGPTRAYASGESVNLTVGTLPPGKSITITFAVTVDGSLSPPNASEVCNQGIVSGSNFADELTDDPDVGGVADPTCTVLDLPTPDLSITKDDGGTVAGFGDTVVYTLTVGNSGDGDATGVVVSESVPANTLFNATASDAGWVCADIVPGSPCTLNLGTVAPAASIPIAFAVDVGTGCILPPLVDTITNSASVTEDGTHGPDPDPLNNSDDDTTAIEAAPDLEISKTDGQDEAQPGDTLSYTIAVSNVGDQAATGVVLTETVPDYTTFNPLLSTPGWACVPDATAGSVCTLPITVPSCVIPGTVVTFTVDVDGSLPPDALEILNEVTVADDNTNGTDPTPDNNTAPDVTALNTPPEADAGGPYNVNEGKTVVLDASATTDGEQPANTLVYEWDLDGDGIFGEVGAPAERGDEVGIAPAFSAVGLDGPLLWTVELLVTDDGGLTDTDTADVHVLNVAPAVTAAPVSQSVQYSDPIAGVTYTVTDIAGDSLALVSAQTDVGGGGFAPGLPDFLLLGFDSCSVAGNLNTCTWTLSGLTGVPAGVYTIRTTFDDDDGGETSADIAITVVAEDATVTFDETNPVSSQVEEDDGKSGPFTLTVFVTETLPDLSATLPAASGDVSMAIVSMSLEPIGPGGSVAGTCTPAGVVGTGYDSILTVMCDFDDVGVNTYLVTVTVDGGYYTGLGEDAFTVFDPSLGFTTGGFRFFWPGTEDSASGYLGDRTNGGYTMKYNRRGTKVQGNLLLMRHLPDGSIIRLKSNSLAGLSIGDGTNTGPFGWASFTGKATYLGRGWVDPQGKYSFVTYVEDHGEPGAGTDRFWVEVKDKRGVVESDLSMSRPPHINAETIEGGNVVVPHKIGRRK